MGNPIGAGVDVSQTDIIGIRKMVEGVIVRLGTRQAPALLHHYTGSAGLHGIVKSSSLRATHVSFMNDASEYLHAVELLRAEVVKALPSSSGPIDRLLLTEMERQLGLVAPDNTRPLFVACFSEKENDLNQWRSYGRGEGGYSIGFSGNGLIDQLRNLPTCFLAPVIYDDSMKQRLLADLLPAVLIEFRRQVSTRPVLTQPTHIVDWVYAMFGAVAAFAPMIKNSAFQEETEWRLICHPASQAEIKFLPKPLGLAPYVEVKFSPLPIECLWSGPGSMTAQSLAAAKAFLENHNYTGVRINRSAIPFRVG